MSRAKIALFVALIFLAGGVAGAGVRSAWKSTPPPSPRPVPREDFANHIFNRMKERLQLTPEQIAKLEPVFRKGIEEVRAIQDRSVKEVDAAVKKNHAELSSLILPEQREKLAEWDREREKAWQNRKGRHRGGPGGSPPNGAFPGKNEGEPKGSPAGEKQGSQVK